MTALAGHRKLCRSVIRSSRFQVVAVMAAIACRGKTGIGSRSMALNAGKPGMRSGQWERRSAVIECRRNPGRCGVACLASVREILGNMVRVGRRGIAGVMAGRTDS